MKKNIITLSLSRTKATDLLKGSLREVSSSAFKTLDQSACYGDVHEGERETTFVIGHGPTGWITAQGNITDCGPEQSQLTYDFKGLPWAFLKKSTLKGHAQHICKTCSQMPQIERDAIEHTDEIFGFMNQSHISKKNLQRLQVMAESPNPEVVDLAALVLQVAKVKPYKKQRMKVLEETQPDLYNKSMRGRPRLCPPQLKHGEQVGGFDVCYAHANHLVNVRNRKIRR